MNEPSESNLAYGFLHFDRQADKSSGTVQVLKGSQFFHGYRDRLPVLNNDRALWMTIDHSEAVQYRDWGRRSGQLGDALVLEARHDMTAISMEPLGTHLLNAIGSTEHSLYGMCLYRWAMSRGHYLIDEGEGAFISIRPARDFSVTVS